MKRSEGQSVTEMVAYRACEKLHSEYYHKTYSFKNKPGLIFSEILLPDFAPERFKDRETLWDEVEFAEKRADAQLAFNFDFSLQSEFTNEENIDIARRFIQENFVSRGMICDWAFHFPDEDSDEEDKNPHIHMLCPMRPLNKDGTWGEKQKLIIFTDEDGNKKRKAARMTDWSDPQTLVEWREAWAQINNELYEKKGMQIRLSADTLEAQGIDRLPTIHEGPNVRAMEKKGIITERGEYNRWVKKINQTIILINEHLNSLVKWIKNLRIQIPNEKSLIDLLDDYMIGRNYGAYSQKAKTENLKRFTSAVNYLTKNGLVTPADLEAHIQYVQEEYDKTKVQKNKIKKRVDTMNADLKTIQRWREVKLIGEQYEKKKFGRDKFYQNHEKEIKSYYYIKKNKQKLTNENAESKIKAELSGLKAEQKTYTSDLEKIESKLKYLKAVQHSIDVAMGKAEDSEAIEIGGKTVFVEKKDISMQTRLNQAKEKAKKLEQSRKEEQITVKDKSRQ